MTRRSLTSLLLAPLVFASTLVGCGRADTVYPGETTDPVKVAGTLPVTTDGRALLPQGFYNQSVNRAIVDVWTNSNDYPYLRLRTLTGSNAVGGFNGTGKGNRALVGISKYDASLLSTVGGISLDVKTDGTYPDVILLVDLDCTGGVPRVMTAAGSDLLPGVDLEGGFERLDAAFSASVWTTNQDITDPANPALVIHATGALGSLDDVVAKYPNACIRNTSSFDLDLPKSIATAGVMIGLGDSSTTLPSSVLIDRIEVGTDVYTEWVP